MLSSFFTFFFHSCASAKKKSVRFLKGDSSWRFITRSFVLHSPFNPPTYLFSFALVWEEILSRLRCEFTAFDFSYNEKIQALLMMVRYFFHLVFSVLCEQTKKLNFFSIIIKMPHDNCRSLTFIAIAKQNSVMNPEENRIGKRLRRRSGWKCICCCCCYSYNPKKNIYNNGRTFHVCQVGVFSHFCSKHNTNSYRQQNKFFETDSHSPRNFHFELSENRCDVEWTNLQEKIHKKQFNIFRIRKQFFVCFSLVFGSCGKFSVVRVEVFLILLWYSSISHLIRVDCCFHLEFFQSKVICYCHELFQQRLFIINQINFSTFSTTNDITTHKLSW